MKNKIWVATKTFLSVCAVLQASIAVADSSSQFSGRASAGGIYFLENKQFRHNRYELLLKDVASYSDRFSSTFEASGWFDAAESSASWAAERNIDARVRDDEMRDMRVRQAYLGYIGDDVSWRIGMQQIDWIDSLSPKSSDVMTPLDLRFGGFGEASDLILAQPAVLISHKLFSHTLEWLAVVAPEAHKLPVGPNGYGYYESLQTIGNGLAARFFPLRPEVDIERTDIPKKPAEAEFGARYLMNFDSLEWTLLAYRGHQRSPSIEATASARAIELRQTFPRLNTFGSIFTYSSDAFVTRLMSFYEPDRAPAFVVLPKKPDDKFNRMRQGLGFDYVFSKHLKAYSEHFYTREVGEGGHQKPQYTSAVRLTNESIDDLVASVDAQITGPGKSHIVSPQLEYALNSHWKLAAGANFIHSLEEDSQYEILKSASNAFLKVNAFF